jgi:PAS domain S-box-containing protein
VEAHNEPGAAAQVEAHEARYRELFELAPDAYLVTDPLGVVREANRAAAALLGVPRRFLSGKPLAVFVDASSRRCFCDSIDRLCRADGVSHWETPLRPRYGSGLVVSVAAAATRDARREVVSIRWILRDVTAERRDRTHADEISARRADLLATLSHEIRTPLHASQGYLELLQMPDTGPLTARQREYLTRMQQCQAYLVTLLHGVLALSRLERGDADLVLSDVVVDTILSTIPPLVEPQVRERRIRYERAHGDLAVTVRADPEKLQQIMLNLITNAVKFTPLDGVVDVSWEALGESVAIRVRDTGSGIRAPDVERIFEPFVQGANVPAGAPAGVGLGLAISRQLARLMGGDLTVVSALGQGATFTLRLPRGSRGDA